MPVQRENSPNNETLVKWASSLRLGDGRRRLVDFSLKRRLVYGFDFNSLRHAK